MLVLDDADSQIEETSMFCQAGISVAVHVDMSTPSRRLHSTVTEPRSASSFSDFVGSTTTNNPPIEPFTSPVGGTSSREQKPTSWFTISSKSAEPRDTVSERRSWHCQCASHQDRSAQLYCVDCTSGLCRECRHSDEHRRHQLQRLDIVAGQLVSRIQSDVRRVSRRAEEFHTHLSQIDITSTRWFHAVHELRAVVASARQKHGKGPSSLSHQLDTVLRALDALEQRESSEVTTRTAKCELALRALDCFRAYSHELVNRGSLTDLMRAAVELHSMGDQLVQTYNVPGQREAPTLPLSSATVTAHVQLVKQRSHRRTTSSADQHNVSRFTYTDSKRTGTGSLKSRHDRQRPVKRLQRSFLSRGFCFLSRLKLKTLSRGGKLFQRMLAFTRYRMLRAFRRVKRGFVFHRVRVPQLIALTLECVVDIASLAGQTIAKQLESAVENGGEVVKEHIERISDAHTRRKVNVSQDIQKKPRSSRNIFRDLSPSASSSSSSSGSSSSSTVTSLPPAVSTITPSPSCGLHSMTSQDELCATSDAASVRETYVYVRRSVATSGGRRVQRERQKAAGTNHKIRSTTYDLQQQSDRRQHSNRHDPPDELTPPCSTYDHETELKTKNSKQMKPRSELRMSQAEPRAAQSTSTNQSSTAAVVLKQEQELLKVASERQKQLDKELKVASVEDKDLRRQMKLSAVRRHPRSGLKEVNEMQKKDCEVQLGLQREQATAKMNESTVRKTRTTKRKETESTVDRQLPVATAASEKVEDLRHEVEVASDRQKCAGLRDLETVDRQDRGRLKHEHVTSVAHQMSEGKMNKRKHRVELEKELRLREVDENVEILYGFRRGRTDKNIRDQDRPMENSGDIFKYNYRSPDRVEDASQKVIVANEAEQQQRTGELEDSASRSQAARSRRHASAHHKRRMDRDRWTGDTTQGMTDPENTRVDQSDDEQKKLLLLSLREDEKTEHHAARRRMARQTDECLASASDSGAVERDVTEKEELAQSCSSTDVIRRPSPSATAASLSPVSQLRAAAGDVNEPAVEIETESNRSASTQQRQFIETISNYYSCAELSSQLDNIRTCEGSSPTPDEDFVGEVLQHANGTEQTEQTNLTHTPVSSPATDSTANEDDQTHTARAHYCQSSTDYLLEKFHERNHVGSKHLTDGVTRDGNHHRVDSSSQQRQQHGVSHSANSSADLATMRVISARYSDQMSIDSSTELTSNRLLVDKATSTTKLHELFDLSSVDGGKLEEALDRERSLKEQLKSVRLHEDELHNRLDELNNTEEQMRAELMLKEELLVEQRLRVQEEEQTALIYSKAQATVLARLQSSDAAHVSTMTSLGAYLYVLRRRDTQQIDVHSITENYVILRHIDVMGLRKHYWNDMTSSPRHRSIYISDWTRHSIVSVDPRRGTIQSTWLLTDAPCGLSITPSDTLLVACPTRQKLLELTVNGDCLREIGLVVSLPWHAVQLSTGQFVVSHGWTRLGHDSGVCHVTTDGTITERYIGLQLHMPCHCAVDQNGFIFVADNDARGQLAVLSPSLVLVRRFSVKDRVKRVHCDTANGRRLYVADDSALVTVIDYNTQLNAYC